jgi:hypothetical protein
MSGRVRSLETTRPAMATNVNCGQWVLQYVLGCSRAEIDARVGHAHPMTLHELLGHLRSVQYAPLIVRHDVLQREGADLWFTNGGDGFLAILADVNLENASEVGHVVVLHGRTLLDPASPTMPQRVSPRVLQQYALALVLSGPSR